MLTAATTAAAMVAAGGCSTAQKRRRTTTRIDKDLAWLGLVRLCSARLGSARLDWTGLALCFLFRVPRCYWRSGVAVLATAAAAAAAVAAAANTKATTRHEHARPLPFGPFCPFFFSITDAATTANTA